MTDDSNLYFQTVLSNMLRIAEKFPGKPQRRDLSGGLRIDVLVDADSNLTKLQLSRNFNYPSATEYAVVLNNWPYFLPLEIEPERTVYNERYYLRCQWETLSLEKIGVD